MGFMSLSTKSSPTSLHFTPVIVNSVSAAKIVRYNRVFTKNLFNLTID